MAAETIKFIAPLTQGFGYGIIIELGFAFSLVMIFIAWALKRYAFYLKPSYGIESDQTDTSVKFRRRKCSRLLDGLSNPGWLLRRW